ncbi:MAG: hypothetical protein HMLKMBBP_00874 [Planctomycetes bacterium]|nr:hypothetical protein [Planctomycetota bacterium]
MRRGITSVDVLTLAALAGVAWLVWKPSRTVERIIEREDEVVRDLADLWERHAAHMAAGGRDQDKDGRPEASPVGDFLGSRAEAAEHVDGSTVWIMDGYRFQMLGPAALDGRPAPVADPSGQVPADYAEVAWMLVAWPERPGRSGMRAYAWTKDGLAIHKVDGYPYERFADRAPDPGMPLVRREGSRIERIEMPFDPKTWGPPSRDVVPSGEGLPQKPAGRDRTKGR